MFVGLLVISLCCKGQQNILETPLTFEVKEERLQEVMSLLAEVADFSFAYNSNLISADSIITYKANGTPLSKVLDDLLGSKIKYKAMGSHLILTGKPNSVKRDKPNFTVSGQVLNAESEEELEDVTLYSDVRLKSDLTDEAGNYQLELKSKAPIQTIRISKMGYRDTTLSVNLSEIYNLDIKLSPNVAQVDTPRRVDGLRIVKFFTNRKQRANALNIRDSITRFAQISFVPIIGSNFRMSGAITNYFSVNIIGGYNGGLKGLELGIGFNIIRNRVQGVQLAAAGNTAGGNVTGVQMAGGYNMNLKDMSGLQMAGGVNIQRGAFAGVQMSGGVNYADKLEGVQMTGGINVVRKEARGVQIAPVNYASHVRGAQIGVINIADTINGTPIGLLSFVRKGYLHFDLYGDDATSLNFSLRTGVHYFHNIVTAGASYDGKDVLWRVGYGLGAEFSLGKKKRGFTNTDFTVSYVTEGSNFITDLNILSVFNWDFGVRIKKHFALFAGPSVKIYTTQYLNPETNQLGLDFGWKPLYSSDETRSLGTDVWVGVRGGFRF